MREIWQSNDTMCTGTYEEVLEYEAKAAKKQQENLVCLKNTYWYVTCGYTPDQKGTWIIKGEDDNPDLAGPHVQPVLGYYVGTFEEACARAAANPRYFTWGCGGSIELLKKL